MNASFSSRFTTWVLRILIFFIALCGACLLMLSTMGGTTDSHRKGLEEAFSESLNADVKIGELSKFNIMPQLDLETKNIEGQFRTGKNEFLADHLVVTFGFSDLILARRRIEDFQLDNLRFSTSSDINLTVDHAGLVKDKAPSFQSKGEFDSKAFQFAIPMSEEAASPPVYYFGKDNKFTGKFGSLNFSGDMVPATDDSQQFIQNMEVRKDQKIIATGHSERAGKGYKIVLECKPAIAPSNDVTADFKSLAKIKFIDLSASCPK